MKNLYSNSFTKFYLEESIVGSKGKFTTWVTSKSMSIIVCKLLNSEFKSVMCSYLQKTLKEMY